MSEPEDIDAVPSSEPAVEPEVARGESPAGDRDFTESGAADVELAANESVGGSPAVAAAPRGVSLADLAGVSGQSVSSGNSELSGEVKSKSKSKRSRAKKDDAPPVDTSRMSWYVLKVQSNREKTIKENLQRRVRMEGLQEFFGEVVIPTEKVAETKGGKVKVREQKLFPGYMMIQMELNDDTWYTVLGTSGVGDFTGAGGKPIPMSESEINRMLGRDKPAPVEGETPAEEIVAVFRFGVQVGDRVKIKEGSFENFEGSVHSLDSQTGKVNVMIEIIGRPMELPLEHSQIEKI